MKATRDEAAAALEALGFTALEARIYVDLLRSGPLTGYRIAQHVGKAAANTYKALEALTRRGVVSYEEGPTRVYSALPYAQVGANLSREFAQRSREAAAALSALDGERPDDRIYRLHGADQITEKARALIESASSIIVADVFPAAVDALAPALEAAAARGVDTVVHVYAPARVRGARIVQRLDGRSVIERWPGTWLNLSVDGTRALIAHLHDAETTIGIWTANAYVAWTFYCGLTSETAMADLAVRAAADPQLRLADALAASDFLRSDVPGRAALYRHMGKKGRST